MLSLVAIAAALLCWPQPSVRDRLRLPASSRGLRFASWVAPAGAGALGLALAGPAGCCAAVAGSLVAGRQWRARRAGERDLRLSDEFAEGLRLLVAQLRAGAHPAIAAEDASAESGPAVAGLFGDLAATARLGGDVTALPLVAASPGLRASLGRLTRAWALAERHGVALADLLDAVRRDLERRTAFRREVEAKLAGPRSTAAVLTGLPLLGLVFGELAGTRPLEVLADGLLGQLALLTGTALLIAGVLWSERLIGAVVRS
ncbi:type II secretion system protein [Saccharopolyspora halophila]|uniref:Type II secretion system protein n=1 Tax=Saccharopolyspora halophila TaxID=405551 RepID=A0ABN3FSC9_9PSEU